MEPLIIIATPNISWLNPGVPYPKTPAEIADEAAQCLENGATILHTHAEGRWIETLYSVRERCNIVIQCGMSSLPIPERIDVYKEHGDMISIILNHHDEAFAEGDFNILHTKDELLEYAHLCREYKVIPEFEVWHTGSIWNLNYLIDKKAINPPYITTLFFGWPGGTWSPPTIQEYLYRRSLMPPGCVINVSIMGSQQREIIAAAILNGDHVRVGTEDYPFNHNGELVSTADLVKQTAEIARSLGRPLATVKQTRVMIGQQT
jgi:3-keto-5-aminohexanoate cleavage enzyme